MRAFTTIWCQVCTKCQHSRPYGQLRTKCQHSRPWYQVSKIPILTHSCWVKILSIHPKPRRIVLETRKYTSMQGDTATKQPTRWQKPSLSTYLNLHFFLFMNINEMKNEKINYILKRHIFKFTWKYQFLLNRYMKEQNKPANTWKFVLCYAANCICKLKTFWEIEKR